MARVLIVDDSNIVRMEAKRILGKYGIEVWELNNAEDLFEFPWRFKNIDVLLLDVVLPGMDGITALEKMRSDREWGPICRQLC